MEQLERLGDQVEASSYADVARGASSALRRKLEHGRLRPEDKRYLKELEALLEIQRQALAGGVSSKSSQGATRHFRAATRKLAPPSLDPEVLEKVSADLHLVLDDKRPDRERIAGILVALDDFMAVWLDAAWQARRGTY
jgi:hypothetical protein